MLHSSLLKFLLASLLISFQPGILAYLECFAVLEDRGNRESCSYWDYEINPSDEDDQISQIRPYHTISLNTKLNISHQHNSWDESGTITPGIINIALVTTNATNGQFEDGIDTARRSRLVFATWLAVGVPVNHSAESELTKTPVKLQPVKLDVFKELPFEYDGATKPLSLNQSYNLVFLSDRGISYNSGTRYQLVERVQPPATPIPSGSPLPSNTVKPEGAATFTSVSITGIAVVAITIGLNVLSTL